MKKIRTVIIGAGQMGRACASLLNPNKVTIEAFGDNDSSKWDGFTVSVEEAVSACPEQVIISVLGDERAEELASQVRKAGYKGEPVFLKDLYNAFDIRSRCVRKLAERIRDSVAGSIAELGVYRGDMAWQLNELFSDRTLYLFDTFKGFDSRDKVYEENIKEGAFSDTSAETVRSRMPYPDKVVFREGYFPDTAEGLEDERYAFVSLDPDLYLPVLKGLEYFYPRMNEGGVIVVHDYDNMQFKGVRKAVDEYEKNYGRMKIVSLGDLHGSCVIIK